LWIYSFFSRDIYGKSVIDAVFGMSLTEFFQNKDSILLSKALADMIESYKKLQITQSVCVSDLRIAYHRSGSTRSCTILTILYLPIIIICVDIAISVICANSFLNEAWKCIVMLDDSVCFYPLSADFVAFFINQHS